MSSRVHLLVSFELSKNDEIAKLAAEHLAFLQSLPEDETPPVEAFWFLEHVSKRTGTNPGSKGGILTWGTVGNYTMPERFISALDNFWTDLFNDKVRGFDHWDRILVLSQGESSWIKAFELVVEGRDKPKGSRRYSVKAHEELKFGWIQGDL